MRHASLVMRRYSSSRPQVNCFVSFIPALMLFCLLSFCIKAFWNGGFKVMLCLLGWFTASFIEYYVHRFLYHQHGHKQKTFLSEHHQYHHKHPTEIKLSRMIKALALLLLFPLVVYAFLYAPSLLIFAGLLCGFCAYAFMHQAIHQPWAARVFPRLFQYHIYHHCKYPNRCFGVSTILWDVVFKTTPPVGATIPKRILHFYLAHHDEEPLPV